MHSGIYLFRNLAFPSLYSDAILHNVHSNSVMETWLVITGAILSGWFLPTCIVSKLQTIYTAPREVKLLVTRILLHHGCLTHGVLVKISWWYNVAKYKVAQCCYPPFATF